MLIDRPKRYEDTAAFLPIVSFVINNAEALPPNNIDGFFTVRMLSSVPSFRYLSEYCVTRGEKTILTRAKKCGPVVLPGLDLFKFLFVNDLSGLGDLLFFFNPMI